MRHPNTIAQAAEEVRRRIREDLKEAPDKVKPLLRYIEEHFLDEKFKVREMIEVCGVGDHSIVTFFHRALGMPPRAYVAERRLRFAALLLSETDLDVQDVADWAAYGSHAVFGRAFTKYAGESPSDFRRKARSGQLQPDHFQHRRLVMKELSGSIEDEELEVLLEQLMARRPRPRAPRPEVRRLPLIRVIDHNKTMRFEAEQLWAGMEDMDPEGERHVVYSIGFTTPAFFELLLEKSREQGRSDRRRGVHLAELAGESLEVCAHLLGDLVPDLRIRALAALGNARRLANDFPGAEKEFALARAKLGAADRHDRRVEAELYDLEASLRLFQRRFEEAMELEDRAIHIFEELGDQRAVAKMLVQKAEVSSYAGNPKTAIPQINAVIQLLDDLERAGLRLSRFR